MTAMILVIMEKIKAIVTTKWNEAKSSGRKKKETNR